MIVVDRTTPEFDRAPDESWVTELADPGPPGQAAQRILHELLLRATRHQVRRLRHQLPGAGPIELEDLAQQSADDALLSVLGKLDTFEGRSRFSTWVFKFGVLHAGVAVRRQAWRHREVGLPDRFEPHDRGATPENSLVAGDLLAAVRTGIAVDLTPHQRHVMLALLVDQVPIDVLAERLNTNRNALYKTLHDARQRLRVSLVASGHLEESPRRRMQ